DASGRRLAGRDAAPAGRRAARRRVGVVGRDGRAPRAAEPRPRLLAGRRLPGARRDGARGDAVGADVDEPLAPGGGPGRRGGRRRPDRPRDRRRPPGRAGHGGALPAAAHDLAAV
ncbi:MAG: hypothetical protein AVDCRST_MAG79-990, partial [uncultured Thermoleophilia bacterium]